MSLELWEWAAVLGVPLGAVLLLRHLPAKKIEESALRWASAAARSFRADAEAIKKEAKERADALEATVKEEGAKTEEDRKRTAALLAETARRSKAEGEEMARAIRSDVERSKAETARALNTIRAEVAGAVEGMDRKISEGERRLNVRLAKIEKAANTDWAHTHEPGDVPHGHRDLGALREEWKTFRSSVEPRAIRATEAARAAEEDATRWEPLGDVAEAKQYRNKLTGEVRKVPVRWSGEVEEGTQEDGLLVPVGVEMAPVPAGLYLAHFRRGAKPSESTKKDALIVNQPDPGSGHVGGPNEMGEGAEEGAGTRPEPDGKPPRKRAAKSPKEEAREKRIAEQMGT